MEEWDGELLTTSQIYLNSKNNCSKKLRCKHMPAVIGAYLLAALRLQPLSVFGAMIMWILKGKVWLGMV